MKFCPSFRTSLLLIFAILIISFLLFSDFNTSHSRLIDELLNLGHLPLFGFIATGVLWVLNRNETNVQGNKSYIYAGIITILFGVFTECIQPLISDRHFELHDVSNDAIGVVTFLSLLFAFQKPLPNRIVFILSVSSLLLVIFSSFPLYHAAVDTKAMYKEFPVIGSFESSHEMDRWEKQRSAFTLTKLHATDGHYSLRVLLYPGEYPGISLKYLQGDWLGYRALCFDIFLEGQTPLKITIKVNDQDHDEIYTDRFNRSILINPGHNHICIDLKEIEHAPKGRLMNMSAISKLSIFTHNLKIPRVICLDNLRLGQYSK